MDEQIQAVQRMQEYIDEHLNEAISPADLSRASMYSPWYSYRLFVKWVGVTPAAYIRRLRLSRSALKLRDEAVRVTDTAYETGFDSVDGYQRAFQREFGCNPQKYAKNPMPLYLFTPYGIKYQYVQKEETMADTKTIFIQTIEKPARKVIIKRGKNASDYFSYCEEVGCDVWGLLTSIKSLSGEPVCLWLPKSHIKPGTSEYVQGAEVALDYDGPVPEGFEMIEFPAGEFLQFQGEPFEEEEYCEAVEQVWEAVKKYDPKVIDREWDDKNPRIQLEPVGTRGYIEQLPVRKVK